MFTNHLWALMFLVFSNVCFGAADSAPTPPSQKGEMGDSPTQNKSAPTDENVTKNTWILGQTGVEGYALTTKVALGTNLTPDWGLEGYYGHQMSMLWLVGDMRVRMYGLDGHRPLPNGFFVNGGIYRLSGVYSTTLPTNNSTSTTIAEWGARLSPGWRWGQSFVVGIELPFLLPIVFTYSQEGDTKSHDELTRVIGTRRLGFLLSMGGKF